MHGWWIYVGTSAVSLLSKHLIQIKGRHIFNPSNFGLVLCFLVLGSSRAEPLDFWWGPMSPWLLLAFAIIIGGALAILTRLKLLRARSRLLGRVRRRGRRARRDRAHDHRALAPRPDRRRVPLAGAATSPEILIFLFFMITDPRTTPRGQRARLAYGAGVGLLAALLMRRCERSTRRRSRSSRR